MVVKVYGPAYSACTQRVLACLIEKDVDFEIIHVNLDLLEQKSPEFLKRQPFGLVPAIEDGDFKLFESRAIIRYYAEKHADRGPNLLGSSLEERAVVDEWLEAEGHNFDKPVYNLVQQHIIFPKMGQATDPALVRTYEHKLQKVLDIYEQRLSETPYLAGDSFTLADLTYLPGIRYLVHGLNYAHFIHQRKHVSAWWNKISSRPAWNKVTALIH